MARTLGLSLESPELAIRIHAAWERAEACRLLRIQNIIPTANLRSGFVRELRKDKYVEHYAIGYHNKSTGDFNGITQTTHPSKKEPATTMEFAFVEGEKKRCTIDAKWWDDDNATFRPHEEGILLKPDQRLWTTTQVGSTQYKLQVIKRINKDSEFKERFQDLIGDKEA